MHTVCARVSCVPPPSTIVGQHFGTTSNKANVNMVNWVTMRNFQSFNCLSMSTLFSLHEILLLVISPTAGGCSLNSMGTQNACVWMSEYDRTMCGNCETVWWSSLPSSLKSSYRSDRWTLTSLPHNCIISTTLLLSINLLIILGHV